MLTEPDTNMTSPPSSTSNPESQATEDSVLEKYRMLYGRQYHARWCNSNYPLPNDTTANNFLDLMHRSIQALTEQKPPPFSWTPDLPTSRRKRAIDVGCGTGIWAIEFAKKHPTWEVIGTDISPIQHPERQANLTFQMENFNRSRGWSFQSNSFDFVHMQCLKESVADWHELLSEACRVLRPGGWLQNVEYSSKVFSKNLRFKDNCLNLYAMGVYTDQIAKLSGCSLSVVEDRHITPILNEVGFRVEDETTKFCALTPAGLQGPDREAALFAETAFRTDIKGYLQLLLIGHLDWNSHMVSNFVERMYSELDTKCLGPFDAYLDVQTIFSQKKPPRGRKRSASSQFPNRRKRREDLSW